MRILVIPSWFPSQAQPMTGSFFVEQAQMVAAEGHEVEFLVPRLVPVPQWRGLAYSRSAVSGLTVHEVTLPALPVILQSTENPMMQALLARAVRVAGLRRPDVLHAHSVMPAAIIARELGIRWNLPVVLTEHSPWSLNRATTGPRARLLFQSVHDATVIATVSRPFADAIELHYAVPRVEVIDLPVPDGYLTVGATAPEHIGGGASHYEFIHVSHLTENKRAELTMAALAQVTGPVRLTIVGGGPERVAELQREAERLGVQDRVRLLGQVSRDQLPAAMAAGHCLVLASAVEAGGTVISEAKSAGLAVIATRTWAGVHGVLEGEGTTCAIDDEQELAAAMQRAVDEQWGVRAEWRAAQRDTARARYCTGVFAQRQVELYQLALDRFAGEHMVFHAPYAIDPQPAAASRLRPKKMLESFHELGGTVHRITGTPLQRSLAYGDLRRRVRRGRRIDYLYSENSTQPNVLASSVRGGIAPFLDSRILRFADRHRIPAGQFYRDVYWRFPGALASSPPLRRAVMEAAYRFDAAVLRRLRTHVFLPSERMGPVVPLPEGRYSALPPGCDVHDSISPEGLHLLYVGGLGSEYGMQLCVEAVRSVPGVSLTMVVRPDDWKRHRAVYEPLMDDSIRVVHARSHELGPIYDQASACVLFVEPGEYRTFAAPVKFFEYMSYGKPILLSEGTYAAEFAAARGIGLEIPYTRDAFTAALHELAEHPEMLQHLAEGAQRERHANTWLRRAQQARARLLGKAIPALDAAEPPHMGASTPGGDPAVNTH